MDKEKEESEVTEMRDDLFGDEDEIIRGKKWSWKNFKSTKNYPVSENLLDWVVGQDKALEECYLCLDEWVHKLKWMQREDWYKALENPQAEKPTAKEFPPAGPCLLLLGDAGTGKSLIGRALASHLTDLYKKYKIKLRDVLCWQNKLIPSEPKISNHDAGEGKKLVRMEKLKRGKKNRLKRLGMKFAMYFMTIIAAIFISIGFVWLWYAYCNWLDNIPVGLGHFAQETPLIDWIMMQFVDIGAKTFLPAGMILLFMIIWIMMGRMGMMNGTKGAGGAEQTETPKLIVDNSENIAPFVDATGHSSPQLFGSISWTPFGTAGPPEHQRVTAGDVHKANLGILYIDEIKNLHSEETVTLLTVLEEGQLPITLRSQLGGAGGSAEMAVATEPVLCLTFLVGAGNFDSINMIHPALMDRIYGYGKVVRMNNDMPNTLENRRKYVQFVAQEIKRFHLIPFSRRACEEIVAEGRRKSGKRDRLSTKFRPLISIIKTSAIIALNEKCEIVEHKHVKEAIDEHCVPPNTKILSSEGLVPISIISNKVISQIGKNQKISHFFSRFYDGNLVGIKPIGYDFVYFTPEHRIKIMRPKKIYKYDYGVFPKGNLEEKWIPAIAVRKYDYLIIPKLKIKENFHNLFIEPEPLGLFIAEGSIKDKYTIYIRMEDKDVLQEVRSFIKYPTLLKPEPKSKLWRLEIRSCKNLVTWLKKEFYLKDKKILPLWFKNLPLKVLSPFLKYYIKGDGFLQNKNTIGCSSNSESLIDSLYYILLRFDVYPYKYYSEDEKQYLGYNWTSKVWILELNPLHSKRLLEQIKLNWKTKTKIRKCRIKETEEYFLVQVREVNKIPYKGEVYNLETEDETYSLPFIVHNCKTIQKQLLEHMIEERGKLLEIKPEGQEIGSIYGLAVMEDEYSGEKTGTVLPVKGFMEKRKNIEKKTHENVKGYFEVTGIAKPEQAKWIDDSVSKVRSVILQRYNMDIAQQCFTHIDFAQSHGVDGPSAGVTMVMLLCSLIERKSIDQSVAVTGEINIGVGNEIKITAVGGIHEKIKAAETWGFKKVVIPMKNLKYSINPEDYTIEIVGAETLEDYLTECLVN